MLSTYGGLDGPHQDAIKFWHASASENSLRSERLR